MKPEEPLKASPTTKDKVRAKFWNQEKRLAELRQHALAGQPEWVVFLLKLTGYKTLPELFRQTWWLADAPREQESERMKVAVATVMHVLKTVEPQDLPEIASSVWPKTIDDRRILLLQLRKPPRSPLKKRPPGQ
jgi:hypothetical protein